MDNILSEMLLAAHQKYIGMKKYFNLTLDQKTIIEEQNVEMLGKNIEDRQIIINDVNQINARIMELEQSLKDDYGIAAFQGIADHECAKQILELSIKTRESIVEAIKLDKHNIEMGKQLIDKIKKEIENAEKSVLASHAYNNNNALNRDRDMPLSIFMDKQM